MRASAGSRPCVACVCPLIGVGLSALRSEVSRRLLIECLGAYVQIVPVDSQEITAHFSTLAFPEI